MDDFVLADSTLPNFSLPPLEMVDLTSPGLSLPDPVRPDPFLPDLTALDEPDDLDRPDMTLPNPYGSDLLQPALPETPEAWALMDERVPQEYGDLTAPTAVQVPLADTLASLAPAAQAMVDSSADAQHLPTGLHYDQVYTTQDEMTHRARHLAPLLLGLDGQVRP